jgi:hypothetical protein
MSRKIGDVVAWGRRTTILLGLALLLLASAGVAQAAGPTWLNDAPQIFSSDSSDIAGISCTSVNFCATAQDQPTVQDGADVFQYAGDIDTREVNAVSCAPGTEFCMFVTTSEAPAGNAGAVAYTGSDFGDADLEFSADQDLESVSCASTTFCVAVSHADKVFRYNGSTWDGGTTETITNSTNQNLVSCPVANACVMVQHSSSAGDVYRILSGSTWSGTTTITGASSTFDSLSCPSSSFCLATGEDGKAFSFNGSAWSAKTVDSQVGFGHLYSSCTSSSFCMAIDYGHSTVFTSTNPGAGSPTWTTSVGSLKQDVDGLDSIAAVESVDCLTTSFCVAGDGEGHGLTFAVDPAPTVPTLSGTPAVGQALTLAHASSDPDAWFLDDWFRCESASGGEGHQCTIDPIASQVGQYTLTSDDADEYDEVRELVGVGFWFSDQLFSIPAGPVTGGPPGGGDPGGGDPGGSGGGATGGAGGGATGGTGPSGSGGGAGGAGSSGSAVGSAPRVGSSISTSSSVVTLTLSCASVLCRGTLTLTDTSKKPRKLGSASYSVGQGKSLKVKINLNATAKRLLKQHHRKLAAKLLVTPSGGKATRKTLTLKQKR